MSIPSSSQSSENSSQTLSSIMIRSPVIKNSFVFQFVYGIDDGLINPLRQFFLAYFLIYRQSLVQTLGQYAAQPIFLDFHQLNHNSTFRYLSKKDTGGSSLVSYNLMLRQHVGRKSVLDTHNPQLPVF